jgi:pimeloyl-ACP methyl ester carboxylesterase
MDTAFDPYALKSLGAELFSDNSQWIKPRLGEITCPVTVIVGEHDHPFIDQAEELAAAVSDGRLTVIAGAYHQPQLTHRAEWTAAVEGHLARTV